MRMDRYWVEARGGQLPMAELTSHGRALQARATQTAIRTLVTRIGRVFKNDMPTGTRHPAHSA